MSDIYITISSSDENEAFQICIEKEDIFEALKAVKIIKCQAKLALIAQRALYDEIKLEAAKRLTDQSLAQKIFADLTRSKEIAIDGIGQRVCLKAVRELTDQAVIAYIANFAPDKTVRTMAAVMMADITSPVYIAALVDILVNGYAAFEPAEVLRRFKEAVGKLTDQVMLEEIVNGDEEAYSFTCREHVFDGYSYFGREQTCLSIYRVDLRNVARKRLAELQENV